RGGMIARVWAPGAASMELERDGKREPMVQAPGGWWRAAAELPHGADYRFCPEGGPPLPDPRSRWQPNGVHGASRSFDPDRFAWTDAGWHPPAWASAIVYELHVGTFTPEGTFDAAITRLDHLVGLGISHVEIMPVAEFSGERGWGYDGVALFAPHHAYGGPEGFQRLINACHARGLAVLLDVVYNHLGPSGNYLASFGPYFTGRYATPWGEALNFDGPESDGVRAFFLANARYWLCDFHLDGLRLDAVHAIADTSARPFLEDLARAVRRWEAETGRAMVLVAESDANDPRLSAPPLAGGCGLDAQWDEDFHHALHAVLTGERTGYFSDFGSLGALAATLRRGFYLDGRYSVFRRRRHGRPFRGSDGARLVMYAQNHDQVGNRAKGERLSRMVSPGRLRIAAVLTLLSPGVPLLFQGEEWGAATPFFYFTDHAEPELAAAVRQGRPAGSPDPQDRVTFARSRLLWHEQDDDLLLWYRALIRLRRTTSLAAHDLDEVRVRHNDRAGWLVLARGPWRIACNFAATRQPVPLGASPSGWRLVLASAAGVALAEDAATLPPDSAAIFAPGQRES
ncbi:MAG: malto-oligosyltrehalose trehalohydrolase, partial [Terriglobales bacterium]